MQSEYPHKKKVKLAAKISKIKRKSDYFKIYKIIKKDANAVENAGEIDMFFHKLTTKTYLKIEEELKKMKKTYNVLDSTSSDTYSDKKDYSAYVEDDFPSQTNINPKLKFSNKEKNLIKKRHYINASSITNNSGSKNENTNIVYTDFNINMSESDKKEDNYVKNTSNTSNTSTV
jgi:hypothetical protein